MNNGNYSHTLKQPGFFAFFCTQFLGAFNDNFLKIVVSFVALDLATSGSSNYVELIAFLFMLPSALFSGYAGHLADVYSKRTILVAVKVCEIVIMFLVLVAFFIGHIQFMLASVFLMGVHSTFFSPAKYGILPEMLPESELSRGNGLLEMSTFIAIILGTSVGGAVFAVWKQNLLFIGVLMTAIAALGALASVSITRVPPSGANKPLRLNPVHEIFAGLQRLRQDRPLWLTVIGISYFWFLGALVQIDILFFGKELLHLDEFHIGLLGTFLALGIGAGSLSAGRLSGDHIELGLVPVGSIAMAICLALVALSSHSYIYTCLSLVLLGFSAGLFAVPLNASLQQRSGKEEKGQLIATNNFMNTIGIFLAAGVHWFLKAPLDFSPDTIVLLIAAVTLAGTLTIFYLLPDYFVRSILWLLTHTLYRIRVVGKEHLPLHGPALLISNHVSFVDAFMIGGSLPRFVRFMLHRDYYDLKGLSGFFRMMHVIPISETNPRDIVRAIREARHELQHGHIVCIFAEGAITRVGHLLSIKRGFEKIVEGTNAPVIPVHLDQLWGSIFSFKGGRFFWKRPRQFPGRVTVSFGAPLPARSGAHEVRSAIAELESRAVGLRESTVGLLHTSFIRMAKRRWFSFCMADTTGTELTYGKTLVASLLLAEKIEQRCSAESMIGVLLPASVAGALTNLAILLAGKVPVNLNFTAGRDAMESAIAECGIKTLITSRLFLSRANLESREGMVFVEDLRKEIRHFEKLSTFLRAFLLPPACLAHRYRSQQPNDLATVIFSSGSTGTPKGVMLSHHNILTNVEGIGQVIQFTSDDRIMGVLPLFHSFGFTGTLWLPLLAGFGAVYHPNPTDARTIGETVQKYRATLLISTPTFYAGYIRRCSKEEFATLRYVIAGAEKLREQIAAAFQEKFGRPILEGYGCTELAPVVSVNILNVGFGKDAQIGNKPGTVGHPIPGVSVKVVHPETFEPLACGEEGLLLVKGPNVMLGYLNQPVLTQEAIRDGWYVTGDIAAVDEDGFIRITDRVSRFSKIGGEMVPHMKVEEVINSILGSAASVVTAVPDSQRGEKLIALYCQNGITTEELWQRLNESELPKLWIPKRENLFAIDSLPVLGSGKADLKKVKALALEKSRTAN
jgi:acyl-[acyl-carrier-protein]-phospholipid O-acyltransferase / long-chain-fatty-acid--[acyl-carrier-protein] ligase